MAELRLTWGMPETVIQSFRAGEQTRRAPEETLAGGVEKPGPPAGASYARSYRTNAESAAHLQRQVQTYGYNSKQWSLLDSEEYSLVAIKNTAKDVGVHFTLSHKCREVWPNPRSEQIFNLFLDVMLLLIPMLIMSLAYSLIMSKLWKGLQREIQHNTCQQQMLQRSCSSTNMLEVIPGNKLSSSENDLQPARQHKLSPPCNAKIMTTVTKNNRRNKKSGDKTETVKMWLMKGFVKVKIPHTASHDFRAYNCTRSPFVPSCKLTTSSCETVSTKEQYTAENCIPEQKIDETTYTFSRHGIRSNYMDKSIEAKKKVIRMLFVIVAEFFICWAPLHILNTWYLFYPDDVYKYVGSTGISLVQLLAYVSSCCNPITYCFMNRKFRQAFLTAFNCRACCCLMCEETIHGTTKCHTNGILKLNQNNSDVSANESTVYLGRASTIGRSEVVVLEAEDRV